MERALLAVGWEDKVSYLDSRGKPKITRKYCFSSKKLGVDFSLFILHKRCVKVYEGSPFSGRLIFKGYLRDAEDVFNLTEIIQKR